MDVVASERTALTAADDLSALGRLWRDALLGLRIWHPNGQSRVLLHLSADVEPTLRISLDATTDTRDQATPMRSPFVISCVRLTYFPGNRLARQWLAAAFAGYCQHEALELVTFGGIAVLDPHREPYESNPFNRCLREGMPAALTPETLIRALAVVMAEDDARELAGWRPKRPCPTGIPSHTDAFGFHPYQPSRCANGCTCEDQ